MKKIFWILIVFTALTFTACSGNSQNSGGGGETQVSNSNAINKVVNVDEFEKLMGELEGVQIVDVRTPGEYSGGHLEGAELIDYNGRNFDSEIEKLDKNKPVLVYCAVGGRSARAAKKMGNAGFSEVYDMGGGFGAWSRAGKPSVK